MFGWLRRLLGGENQHEERSSPATSADDGMTPFEDDILEKIQAHDVDGVRLALEGKPELILKRVAGQLWLHFAVNNKDLELTRLFLDWGCDINDCVMVGEDVTDETPLVYAVQADNVALVRLLLERGADPNIGEPVIDAITGEMEQGLEMVKLLEKYGADIHVVYPFGEEGVPMNALQMALDWGKDDVADYLRSRGARLPGVVDENGT